MKTKQAARKIDLEPKAGGSGLSVRQKAKLPTVGVIQKVEPLSKSAANCEAGGPTKSQKDKFETVEYIDPGSSDITSGMFLFF